MMPISAIPHTATTMPVVLYTLFARLGSQSHLLQNGVLLYFIHMTTCGMWTHFTLSHPARSSGASPPVTHRLPAFGGRQPPLHALARNTLLAAMLLSVSVPYCTSAVCRMWTYFTLSHPDFTGELDPDPELLAQEREAEQQRLYEAMNSHNSSLHSTHTSLSMSGGSAGLAAAGPAGSPGGLPLSRTASGSSAGGGGGGDARGRGQGQTVKGCFASGWLRQCHLAYWTSLFLIVVILLNTATFCVESIPHYEGTPVEDALTWVLMLGGIGSHVSTPGNRSATPPGMQLRVH